MLKRLHIPPMSRTDKLLSLALAGCFLAPHLAVWAMDEAAIRAAEGDKPAVEAAAVAPPVDCTPLVEAMEAVREAEQSDPYDETIPLDRELQAALREACKEHGVPISLALGLIEMESGFRTDAVSSEGAYGLCQLNPKYFPADLDPTENISAGVAWLGELLNRYEDTAAALTVYNAGRDTGSRRYAAAVLAAAERWEELQ